MLWNSLLTVISIYCWIYCIFKFHEKWFKIEWLVKNVTYVNENAFSINRRNQKAAECAVFQRETDYLYAVIKESSLLHTQKKKWAATEKKKLQLVIPENQLNDLNFLWQRRKRINSFVILFYYWIKIEIIKTCYLNSLFVITIMKKVTFI